MDADGYNVFDQPSPEDVTINCLDCGTSFVFTAGERRFFEAKSFTVPFRCRSCRLVRRAAREREDAS